MLTVAEAIALAHLYGIQCALPIGHDLIGPVRPSLITSTHIWLRHERRWEPAKELHSDVLVRVFQVVDCQDLRVWMEANCPIPV